MMFKQHQDESFNERRQFDLARDLNSFSARPMIVSDLDIQKLENVYFLPCKEAITLGLEEVQNQLENQYLPVYQLWEELNQQLLDRGAKRYSLGCVINECINLEAALVTSEQYMIFDDPELFDLLASHITLKTLVDSNLAQLRRYRKEAASVTLNRYDRTVSLSLSSSQDEPANLQIAEGLVFEVTRPRFIWIGEQKINKKALVRLLLEVDSALNDVSKTLERNKKSLIQDLKTIGRE
jgi:hypothetical protein